MECCLSYIPNRADIVLIGIKVFKMAGEKISKIVIGLFLVL